MNSVFIDAHYANNEEIKNTLLTASIENYYELEDGSINVEESSTVQVKIRKSGERLQTRMEFPQVGNTIQIITTVILIGVFSSVSFPRPFIAAILLGQLISFGFHYPKIKKLQEQVIQALKRPNT